MGLTVEPFGLAIGMEDVHGGLFTAIQEWREPHHVALSYY